MTSFSYLRTILPLGQFGPFGLNCPASKVNPMLEIEFRLILEKWTRMLVEHIANFCQFRSQVLTSFGQLCNWCMKESNFGDMPALCIFETLSASLDV